MEELIGTVERITYHNPENGYTVAQLKVPKQDSTTTVVGCMPGLQTAENVSCQGEWKRHLVHGWQFEVKGFSTSLPVDINGIRKYLGSGLIRGIGPVFADKIVGAFGETTLEVLEKTPERVLEIPGVGKKKLEKILACWQEQKAVRQVMIFLQSHGVTPSIARKIYRTYGDSSCQKVQENPYCLARDIFGIGFKTADKIASSLNVAKDSPLRLTAGVEYVLNELAGRGHVLAPRSELKKAAAATLECPEELTESAIDTLQKESRIMVEQEAVNGTLQDCVWLKPLFFAEKGIAKEANRLRKAASTFPKIDEEKALAWAETTLKMEFGPEQKKAIAVSLKEKFSIITGGPGTGKSTITNAILRILRKAKDKIFLAAPTGKAAKRLREITGMPASTLHSLLEFDVRTFGFKRNRENPLDCDLLLIDEVSMIDTLLMYSTLKALPDRAHLILVGDVDQLPSVGPGAVLKDFIDSTAIPVTRLKEVYRQAKDSFIITNAHKINESQFPALITPKTSDFFFIEKQEPEHVLETIKMLVTARIPAKFGWDPIRDIQVLAPMKKGSIGTENLNNVLQESLNPQKTAVVRGSKRLAVGDKVIQLRNNYKKEVLNGDVGQILSIDFEENCLAASFDDKEVHYEFSELDELDLAYAVSVHKYQGSESPCIVMPLHTAHFKMLQKNLLYTGVTRAKKLLVLVGTKKAMAIAIHQNEAEERFTGLKNALARYTLPF